LIPVRFYDAHNHLQDDRLQNCDGLIETCRREHVLAMVVNGSAEEDWGAVESLARTYPEVIPSFGYHPWYITERTDTWIERLQHLLDSTPSAIGEIGLDRWKPDLPYHGQEEVFRTQLAIAAERNVPASIHCLKAWGRLYELLKEGPVPRCGFLLHSYGGSQEMVAPLAKLGAYFSFPGYFARAAKVRQREVFRHVPPDRLLIETDAPDQLPPDERIVYPLADAKGKPINHPANLRSIYEAVADLFQEPVEKLAGRVAMNFERLFGGITGKRRSI
jgi:TatD DNase family protein